MNPKITNVTVAGAGFMGTEIASRAMLYGYNVRVFDINPEALEKSRLTIELFLQVKVDQGIIKEGLAQVLEKVDFSTDLESSVDGADMVIEAVAENLKIKQELFSRLDQLVSPEAILATNSSSIPISRIETGIQNRQRILNMHFYAPIENVYFVELMRGKETSQEVIKQSSEWLVSLDCLPLICQKESVGFIFNRVWHAARREAMKVWAEGVAEIEDIDKAWMLFTGMPFGPFGIMDFIGLDVVYSVQNLYYEDTGDDYFKPPDQLKKMVGKGDLGVKSGRGFYQWPEAGCVHPDFLKPSLPD